ncbi:unnamed protein product [Soboliphyme baturini]|uniref:long-chain-fatty-acid--CoA ligase n=1 Tax=Soboliphyme baturini TaxID=241478 RepID=A0A183IHH1_9BILA|nr:unnamed protein product [Soboliphyme baturini]
MALVTFYLAYKVEYEPAIRATAQDVAFIMFSSGTTADPKGIPISHANVIAATAAQSAVIPNVSLDDVYIGYLPLAHILEFDAEFCCLANGVRIGYSSPLTLTDNASKIKRGARGDCAVLNPTLIATVPTVMDRIYKAVIGKLQNSSHLRQAIFEFVYELKRSRLESGYSTPFLNRLIFSHISNILGNRVRLILSGGAPLNPETQRFINICFCCPVGQGYGLTETCGAGTICHSDDLTTGRVGSPLACNDIMLRNWNEGGYMIQNKPHPQGEILISGANVIKGYLANSGSAADFIEIDGRTWFCSGDIGEFYSDGCLKIIDRRKDLIKLQHGEYVSVARVETVLLTCPLIDYVCVYGNSLYSYLVAIVVPNQKNLTEFAKEVSNKLLKYEVPQKFYLCKEKWTAEMGLLTDALKLKRKAIENFYKDVLESLYAL